MPRYELTQKWLDRVDYDMDTAKAMLPQTKRNNRRCLSGFHPVFRGDNPMALSKDEVMTIIKLFLAQCTKKHDVKEAYLFGSFAKGTSGDYSDIDLAVITGSLRHSEDALSDEEFEIFHEAQQCDSRLEVVSFTEEGFSRDLSALSRRIKQEGIAAM
jgi:predicted nucleotidyltransferase